MWRHVPRVAGLLTLQGGLELVVAVVLLLGAADSDTRPPAALYDIFLLRIAPWGLLVTGSLKALAGRRNRSFRDRRLGALALWSGVPSSAVGVCAPSALALLVYGNHVYRDATSRYAFLLGESGKATDEVAALMEERTRR
jgi:hypothetical protein